MLWTFVGTFDVVINAPGIVYLKSYLTIHPNRKQKALYSLISEKSTQGFQMLLYSYP